MNTAGRILVWDPLVRCFHWLLVLGFFAAYFTRHSPGQIHDWLGYGVLALIIFRVGWGFFGPRRARFSDFIPGPAATIQYAKAVWSGKQARYIGHNPLGGWMALVLLFCITVTCISGWLYTTDRFWGYEWVENLHEAFTWITMALVALHVSGVIHASRHGHENLVAAMFHGRKRAPTGSDID